MDHEVPFLSMSVFYIYTWYCQRQRYFILEIIKQNYILVKGNAVWEEIKPLKIQFYILTAKFQYQSSHYVTWGKSGSS